jgi:hypothetical protein
MVLVKVKEVKGKIRRDDLVPFRDEVSGVTRDREIEKINGRSQEAWARSFVI